MVRLADKKDCTGCTACFSACSIGAVEMLPDVEGFLYPRVNAEKCVECGSCSSACPMLHIDSLRSDNVISAYGMKHKDSELRKNSASGGAFSAIAQYMIRKHNAYIFGAAFNESFKVVHICGSSCEELQPMRSSKYVQSDLGETFRNIKKLLDSGEFVVFTGTPCQVHGLKCFLKKDYPGLLTVDLICHGVPSPKIWRDYIEFIENRYKGKLTGCNMRSKWKGIHTKIEIDCSRTYEDENDVLSFLDIFYSSFPMRPSCFRCKYTNLKRVSDITIADFWGLENVNPAFSDESGVSFILLNTKKGTNVFDGSKCETDFFESQPDKSRQPHLRMPIKINSESERKRFWRIYRRKGYKGIAVHYSRFSPMGKFEKEFRRFKTRVLNKLNRILQKL